MRYKIYSLLLMSSLFTVSMYASMLQREVIQGQRQRLQVASVENATDTLEFQLFSGGSSSLGIVQPISTLTFAKDKNYLKPVFLYQRDPFMIKCIKGSYLPVFIQDGGPTSGTLEPGYEGPYYVSMWLRYPQVSESSKLHIRYMLKRGKLGKIGVKIGSKGDYRLVAHENVKFL